MSFTQKLRGKLIVQSYKNWGVENKKVLDVGCGNGVVSKVLMEKLHLDLFGTDILDYRKENIPFKKMDPARLPFEDASFDYVLFNDVLHHSEYIESLLLEAKRVGKHLLIFEVQDGPVFRIFDVVLNSLYHADMPHPENFKTSEEWSVLFDRLGFHCEKGEVQHPVWYPFKHMAFKLTSKVH
ncbi:MAG: class I SAM-dependent methyltransferase [Deltaproteobacteria bacterium]|nr:class I SAM-dependent methyltransferase [Deltaproteobacteria bacterium]